jgi:hypothetical protein
MANQNDQHLIESLLLTVSKDFTVTSSGNKFVIKSADRGDLKNKLYALLDKQKFPYEDVKTNDSSFNSTKIKLPSGTSATLVYKNSKAGGSGAGAEATALGESAQCWYNAVDFRYTLESQDDFLKHCEKVKPICDTTSSLDEVSTKLSDDWINSSIKTAHVLNKFQKIKKNSKNYEFHRGSSLVDTISDAFKSANNEQRMFSNINKWSPADIWLFTNSGKREIDSKLKKVTSFAQLNSVIKSLYDSEDAIGVSLKKIESQIPHIEVFNYGKSNAKEAEFLNFITGATLFNSKDIYIRFKYKGEEMKIQFRSFSDTNSWQGEIKGKFANGGKIGGGVAAEIFKRITGKTLDSLDGKVMTARAKKFDKELIDNLLTRSKKLSIPFNEKTFVIDVMKKPADWLFSKYLGIDLAFNFSMLNSDLKAKYLSELVGYAASSTENSGVFIKVS